MLSDGCNSSMRLPAMSAEVSNPVDAATVGWQGFAMRTSTAQCRAEKDREEWQHPPAHERVVGESSPERMSHSSFTRHHIFSGFLDASSLIRSFVILLGVVLLQRRSFVLARVDRKNTLTANGKRRITCQSPPIRPKLQTRRSQPAALRLLQYRARQRSVHCNLPLPHTSWRSVADNRH